MEITGVRVKLNPNLENSKLKGFATITFDDSFMVHNIKVIEGTAGLFVAMPDRMLKNGKSVNVAHPVNKETRNLITEKILSEFENVKSGLSPELGSENKKETEGEKEEEIKEEPVKKETLPEENLGTEL